MKKTGLLIAIILSSELLYGCTMLEKEKDKFLSISTGTKTEASKTNGETEKTTGETSTSSNWDTLSDEAEITPDNSVGLEPSTKNTDAKTNTAQTTAKAETKVDLAVTKSQIQEYLFMNKASILKKFGSNYKKDGNAISYSNGITFYGLTTNESMPTSIRVKDNVSIMGIKNGMNFEKIQAVLGKTNLIETYINVKTNKAYKVQYTFEKFLLKAVSTKKDGSSSYIEAVRQ